MPFALPGNAFLERVKKDNILQKKLTPDEQRMPFAGNSFRERER